MRARALIVAWAAAGAGCGSDPKAGSAPPDVPSPAYRNIETATPYVGDSACVACHETAAAAYRTHAMARSFHRWTPQTRVEAPMDTPIVHASTRFAYVVVEEDGWLYQVEVLQDPAGRRLHEMRRRIDWVMGSGVIARTYFTDDNGRLFQLPLSWYGAQGWDFSPGYELNNARFGRLLPDGCIACHGSYPERLPHLEGKYAALPPGIGCERCHGPGALHLRERGQGLPVADSYDNTIVHPSDLPLERRLDVCEQCHVHTAVTVLREGRDVFGYLPSQRLADHAAFFKPAGQIDIVSHADRLRQSLCFQAARATARPLECATCHDPHAPADASVRSAACEECHDPTVVAAELAPAPTAAAHAVAADCVGCHMPPVRDRTVPHGSFTDHWIRVVERTGPERRASRSGGPVEPYYERDRRGPEAPIYQAMGAVVYASRASDARLLRRAANALRKAVGTDTGRPDAQFLLGLAFRQLGRHTEAAEALERSLQADPDRPEGLHALAKSYEATGRSSGDIAPLYERALALQPALAWIRAEYAHFLHAEGRHAEAETAYRDALAERPSLDVAAFNLATLLAAAGRWEEAGEAFRTAVGLNPSLGEALAPLVELRVAGLTVTDVRLVGAPVEVLPMRGRGPRAVQLTVRRGFNREVLFVNVPAGGRIRVLRPDGAVMRVLRATDDPTLSWDLLTDRGIPIAGGLYTAEVHSRGGSGGPLPPQRFAFGVVRMTR